jgi:pheromone shutdown protein TraB
MHFGSATGIRMLGLWLLVTSVAGALGCLLALAHPLTILTGFFFAPIGALHPLVATGWVTGLVEAALRKPRVADFETLTREPLTIRGLYQNRVTRILLVGLLTNVTVGLGNLAGAGLMLTARH